MGNIITIGIIAVIVIAAILSGFKHFKGEGGCCGGGGSLKPIKKKLEGRVIAKKIIKIEGMHCENCKNSVERSINRIEGAAAQVSLKRNEAVVSMDRDVPDEELRAAVERVDFKVKAIELKEV